MLVEKAAPELSGALIRLMPAQTALAILGNAAGKGMSALELFTSDMVREDCAVLIDEEALEEVDAAFDLGLITDLSGKDVNGKPFKTVAFIFGRERLISVHDRGGFSYYHPKFKETFTYQSIVRSHSPRPGLATVQGIKGPMGLSVESFRMAAKGTVEVKLGPMSVKRPLPPITRR